MKAEYDTECHALYVYCKDTKVHRTECDETWDIAIDYDADGDVVGYEFLLGAPLKEIPYE